MGGGWTETSVGRGLLKSAPAKVTQNEGQYRIIGAAWGAPVDRVEVQIDGGPWVPADDRPQRGGRVRLEDLVAGLGERDAGRAQRSPRARSTRPDRSSRRWTTRGSPTSSTYWESNGQVTRKVLVT